MNFKYQKLPFRGHDSRKPLVARPLIPIYLVGKAEETASPYYALLDSGADSIIFPAELAEQVGIFDITSGRLEPTIGIANQRADVYYHKLGVRVVGYEKILYTEIGFSKNILIPLLGRSFFKHFKTVVFNEAKENVELKP